MRHHVSSCFIVSSSCAAIVKARNIERLQAMKAKEKFNNRCNMTRKQKQTQIERAEYWTYWDILRWAKSQDETANSEAFIGLCGKVTRRCVTSWSTRQAHWKPLHQRMLSILNICYICYMWMICVSSWKGLVEFDDRWHFLKREKGMRILRSWHGFGFEIMWDHVGRFF